MEIDKNKLMEKIGSMSDDELRSVIKSIALSAGVSEKKADRVLKDVGKIRRGVGKLGEREIEFALGKLDDETVGKIKQQLE